MKVVERRKFLKKAVIGGIAGAAALSYPVYKLLSPDYTARWPFLQKRDTDKEGYIKDYELGSQPWKFVPIGPEIPDIVDEAIEKELMNSARRQLSTFMMAVGRDGMIASPLYDPRNRELKGFQKHFGIPDLPGYSEIVTSAIEYFRRAVDFLYDNLNGLDESNRNIEWVPLKDYGDNDHTSGFSHKGFVGRGFLIDRKVRLSDSEKVTGKNSSDRPVLASDVEFDDEGFVLYLPHESDQDEWCLLLPTNESAVRQIFSEVASLSLMETYKKNTDSIGHEGAYQAMDTFCQGLSLYLSDKISGKLGIGGIKGPAETAAELANRDPAAFKYIGHAYEWIKANSLQKAFDLYRTNPRAFMEAIGTRT